LKKRIEISDESESIDYLLKEKDLYEQIINNSRSMISIINRNYIYEKVNDPFCKAHNLIMDSIVGKSLSDVWGEETFNRVIKSNLDQCFSGTTVRYEASFNTPVLGNRFFEVIFRPLRSGSGEITHLLAETFDINELELSRQAALEHSSRELILENRLMQAQKLETIGALAGGIAHDFNNILAIISGYAEMLQDDLPKSSEHSEKVSKIQGAVLKARSLTNQILTFSRQVEQEKIPVNISDVLKETIGLVRSAISPDIKIKSFIPKKDINVFADPTQLFRVFLNLMTNGIQAMEDDGGTLSVKLEIVEGESVRHELKRDIVADEYVLLTFRDTGKGMDPSLAKRIFEPFFTTREVGKGTGLGLSVVHGIVSEMEGEILISTRENKGSVFYIYIPVSNEYADLTEYQVEKKRILFIRGNKYESRIFSLALESSGYELIFASDRKQMIRILTAEIQRPDMIIFMSDSKQIKPSDLLAVFSQVRSKTPCILITDQNEGLLDEKLLNSGIVSQHLIKPVSLREIRNAIGLSIK
jgi:PAS domain S-box-containing protein